MSSFNHQIRLLKGEYTQAVFQDYNNRDKALNNNFNGASPRVMHF